MAGSRAIFRTDWNRRIIQIARSAAGLRSVLVGIVLFGLALAASAVFLCPAVATSVVGHTVTNFRADGSGPYLSAYSSAA